MIVGFTAGAFDLCHYGHVLMFEECSQLCERLVVFVQTDPSIDRPEKNRPIQSLEERIGQVRALRSVNEVRTYSTEASLLDRIESLRKECELAGHDLVRFLGADWEGKPFTGHDLPVRVRFTSRNHAYSSSELRSRIYAAEAQRVRNL